MLDVLLLRLDAPLMSFGSVSVDNHGTTYCFPTRSMLVGLLANALGYDRTEAEKLGKLQAALRYAARCDEPGQPLRDYQTVDLGQDFMVDTGWTTWGHPETRAGAPATAEGTHIRYRDYRADALYLVALAISSPGLLDAAEEAIQHPIRPLFLGRKPCVPASRIREGRVQARSLLTALQTYPRLSRPGLPSRVEECEFWWSSEDEERTELRGIELVRVTDERDWANQIHVGHRMLNYAQLPLEVPRGQ